ncbi:hypothetical protein RQP46_002353 [Phenoliferia psychrophenolica]
MPSGTPPRKPAPLGAVRMPKVAAFAANRLREAVQGGPNHSPRAGAGGERNASFASVAGEAAQPSLVVESQRFEEWMKIATDNKITSTNTWNLALIDYFADMSLLRNGDDNSINFQKASCTLDGCVKIWTSRVDSVATQTGKLLSGLAEDGRAAAEGDDDDEGSDDDDEAQEARRAKRKTARQAATLADTFDKIKVKQFDLEFTVDPLFKKTSADFDEGGAGGILMNHLGCDGDMKIVFDAGDARLEQVDVEDDEVDDIDDDVELDIGRLVGKHIPSDVFDSLASMTLCPSLAAFRFSPDANLDLDILNPIDDVAPVFHPEPRVGGDAAQNADEDHFDHNNDFGGGGGDDDFGDESGGAGQATGDGSDDFFEGLGGEPSGSGGYGDVSGEGGASEVTVEMGQQSRAGGHMFDGLDAALEKNWAGPEHWKMRRIAVRKDEAGATATARQRKEKVAFALDFAKPVSLDQKDLFLAAPTVASIRAPRKSSLAPRKSSSRSRRSSRAVPATSKANDDAFTLPTDFHFNSAVLLRLFLKPTAQLRMRRRGTTAGGGNSAILDGNSMEVGGAGGEGGEDGAGFWAGQNGGDDDDDDMGGHDDFGGFEAPDAVPFNTQFINDDDDGTPDLDEDDDNGEDGDLFLATQGQLRKTARINIGHARKATRLDIKRLKDTIWRELEDLTIRVPSLPTEPAYSTAPDPATVDSEPPKPEALVPVIQGLRRAYPADKMAEVSTSFCFICLLHLANENGLRIQTPDAGPERDDGLMKRAMVGGLDKLRVFREIAA